MRLLITSGIWPPDVGGPASHGPDLGSFLVRRGHDVRAVAAADREAQLGLAFPARVVVRRRTAPARIAETTAALARAIRDREIVYCAGMATRTVGLARARRIPVVLKLPSDPAYERSRHRGWFSGLPEDFERATDRRVRALMRQRDLVLSQVDRLVIPSHYLAEVARGWGIPDERIAVISNPAPRVQRMESHDELRRAHGLTRPTVVWAGRMVKQKNLPLAVRAMARVPGADLVLIGAGPEEEAVRALVAELGIEVRVRMEGPKSREEVVRWLGAADVALLSSDWENLPHATVEAVTMGTPVVATDVGGVGEVVQDGVSGLLVPPRDEAALAAAVQRVLSEPGLAARLRAGAEEAGERLHPDAIFGRIEQELTSLLQRGPSSSA